MDKPVYKHSFYLSLSGIISFLAGPGILISYAALIAYGKYWNSEHIENVELILIILVPLIIWITSVMDYRLKIFKDRIEIKERFGWDKGIIDFEDIRYIDFSPPNQIFIHYYVGEKMPLKVHSIPKTLIALHEVGVDVRANIGKSRRWKRKLSRLL